MSSATDKLKKELNNISKKNKPEGTVWGIVKDIDWSLKTMTVESLKDGLDYYDVSLGIGYNFKKPKINSKCLIAPKENNPNSMILVDANEIEELAFKVGLNELTVTEDETVIKKGNTKLVITDDGLEIDRNGENLNKVINDFFKEFTKLCDEVSLIVVVQGTSPNVVNIGLIKASVETGIKQRLNTILKQ